jgi:hypothetical protein
MSLQTTGNSSLETDELHAIGHDAITVLEQRMGGAASLSRYFC